MPRKKFKHKKYSNQRGKNNNKNDNISEKCDKAQPEGFTSSDKDENDDDIVDNIVFVEERLTEDTSKHNFFVKFQSSVL
jgi:hypothetical protein